jgi:hypothetical protein
VRFELVSHVAVRRETPSAQLLAIIVGGYKLCDPRESLGTRRYLVAQVDQQITWLDRLVFTTGTVLFSRYAFSARRQANV